MNAKLKNILLDIFGFVIQEGTGALISWDLLTQLSGIAIAEIIN